MKKTNNRPERKPAPGPMSKEKEKAYKNGYTVRVQNRPPRGK